MKYLIAYKNDKGKYLIKIGLDDGKEKWATTSEAVYTYAKANFKAKEDVEYEMTDKNGQYNVTKIMKKGQKSVTKTEPVKTESEKSSEFKCEVCGKELKDGKYKKCFVCNKKNPTPKTDTTAKTTTYTGGQRDAVGQSIEKQAMMKASADAVATAMQGQINDIDVLGEMIVKLYEKLLAKLTE